MLELPKWTVRGFIVQNTAQNNQEDVEKLALLNTISK